MQAIECEFLAEELAHRAALAVDKYLNRGKRITVDYK